MFNYQVTSQGRSSVWTKQSSEEEKHQRSVHESMKIELILARILTNTVSQCRVFQRSEQNND